MHLLLGSNKDRTRSTQTLVNSGLYWIEGFSKGNSFTSLYCVSKELNVPPLSVKCEIAQVRCFKKKWKNSKCIISDLLRDISRCRCHAWDKESKILADKLDKFPSRKKKKKKKKNDFKFLLGKRYGRKIN